MITDSVAFCRGARQARRLRRRALLRRLARRLAATRSSACGRRSRPAPRTSPSATPTAPACRRQVAEATAAVVADARAIGSRSGIHTHNDAECGVANSLAAVEAGARLVQGTMNGYGERCGNANLVSILPALQLKLGYECVPAGAAAAADRDRALRRRALQPDARPRPALRRAQRVRPQGRHARRRRAGRRAHLRAPRPGAGRQQPRRPDLRALGQGLGALSRAEGAGIDLDADAAKRARRAAQGARAPRLPLRGRRRLVRAAAAPRGGRLRAAVPARELPGDHREARRRQGRDRGDDQDLGRRPALRAHGRGQRAR